MLNKLLEFDVHFTSIIHLVNVLHIFLLLTHSFMRELGWRHSDCITASTTGQMRVIHWQQLKVKGLLLYSLLLLEVNSHAMLAQSMVGQSLKGQGHSNTLYM